MSKLDELIRELCPDGVQVFRLEEIAHYAKTRIDCKTINEDNYVGVENLLQNKAGKTKATSVPTTGMVIAYQKNDILIGNIRPYLRKVWLADCEGGTNGDVLTVQIEDTEKVLPQFLYYVLSSEKFFLYDIQNSKGAKMPRGSKDAVMKFEVPLPHLDVQHEIVRILDNFTNLTAELTAELTARKNQYEFYRDKLLTYDSKTKIMPLKDVAEIERGTRVVRSQLTEDGLYPVFQNALTPMGYNDKANRLGNNTFLICAGAAGQIGYSDVDFWAADDCYTFKCCEKLENRYLFHVLKNNQHRIDAQVRRASIPRISREAVGNIRIPIPPLDVQNRIVNVLDNFEKICSDLNIGLPAEIEARQKQYEYYRDKLLTFAETGNTILNGTERNGTERNGTER